METIKITYKNGKIYTRRCYNLEECSSSWVVTLPAICGIAEIVVYDKGAYIAKIEIVKED